MKLLVTETKFGVYLSSEILSWAGNKLKKWLNVISATNVIVGRKKLPTTKNILEYINISDWEIVLEYMNELRIKFV